MYINNKTITIKNLICKGDKHASPDFFRKLRKIVSKVGVAIRLKLS